MSAIQQAHEFSERPSMISQAGFHRWRNAQALVNLDKVVVHEMQGDRITVIIDFLAEPIRKAGEAPHVHSHGEILSLDVARAHILMLGIADNRLHLSTDAASGTVMPRFFFGERHRVYGGLHNPHPSRRRLLRLAGMVCAHQSSIEYD